jgi:hypothetical protein
MVYEMRAAGGLKAVSMGHWFRLFLSVLALAGLLAAGAGGAVAMPNHNHQYHHCCPTMTSCMSMDAHQTGGGDHAAVPDCCLSGLCAVAQPDLPSHAVVISRRAFVQVFLPALDEAGDPSLPISPDLRPPIA